MSDDKGSKELGLREGVVALLVIPLLVASPPTLSLFHNLQSGTAMVLLKITVELLCLLFKNKFREEKKTPAYTHNFNFKNVLAREREKKVSFQRFVMLHLWLFQLVF